MHGNKAEKLIPIENRINGTFRNELNREFGEKKIAVLKETWLKSTGQNENSTSAVYELSVKHNTNKQIASQCRIDFHRLSSNSLFQLIFQIC